jgi:NAD(P)-dependent dehydrogenase (short-subunit alcohol dehydrogenase family)
VLKPYSVVFRYPALRSKADELGKDGRRLDEMVRQRLTIRLAADSPAAGASSARSSPGNEVPQPMTDGQRSLKNMLDDRVAVVTGGGRGIGASVSRLLAREGARVVVADLGTALDGDGSDAAPAEAVARSIRDAGGEALADNTDVGSFDAARRLVSRAVAEFGRLDIVINAAGIVRDRMIFNMSEEEWDAVVRVHLKGTFNVTRHAAAHWRSLQNPNGQFRIINFTSGAGLHGLPGQPNYAAAKMGIVGLTYSCANALRKYGVTSNAMAPDAATRMMDVLPEDRRRALAPAEAERSPDNIAPAVVYLASEASSWCNGQVIWARGYQVGLYSVPEVTRIVGSTDEWTPKSVGLLMEQNFRPQA